MPRSPAERALAAPLRGMHVPCHRSSRGIWHGNCKWSLVIRPFTALISLWIALAPPVPPPAAGRRGADHLARVQAPIAAARTSDERGRPMSLPRAPTTSCAPPTARRRRVVRGRSDARRRRRLSAKAARLRGARPIAVGEVMRRDRTGNQRPARASWGRWLRTMSPYCRNRYCRSLQDTIHQHSVR